MSVHLVSLIDVKDFGAETVRVGDLNADGAPDLLFVQSDPCTREITCLTAATILGEILWQSGTPSPDNGTIYADLPIQVYDWDGDGVNEVLWIEQAIYAESLVWDYAAGRQVVMHTTKRGELRGRKGFAQEGAKRYEGDAIMHVLDARNGREKHSFPLPAPADDCFLFADLTGRGRRQDLVVKDRYWNMWGVSHEGKVLWHWPGNPGHFPAVADLDGDGRDEVFVGLALIDHDGRELFRSDVQEHQDAVYLWRMADGSWRLFTVDVGIRCLLPDGTELWRHPLKHAQHVVVGRFRNDAPAHAAAIDRTQPDSLLLYDLDGRELWRREIPEARAGWCAGLVGIDWFGGDAPNGMLVYGRGAGQPVAIHDGDGEIVDTCPMLYTPDRTEEDRKRGFYCYRANLWGGSREEVILFGSRGACIYANARPLAIPTLYNNTLYPGM